MDIVGFDFRRHFIQRQRTIRRGVDRLRLNTAEDRRAAGFVQIVMRPRRRYTLRRAGNG